jgi:hypothetical protein
MITILPTRYWEGFPIRYWEEACFLPNRCWVVACYPIGSPWGPWAAWVVGCRIRRSSWVAAGLPIRPASAHPSWVAAYCRSSLPVQSWVVTRSLPSCSGRRSRAAPCRLIVPYRKDRHILHEGGGTIATAHVRVAENSLDVESPCADQVIID